MRLHDRPLLLYAAVGIVGCAWGLWWRFEQLAIVDANLFRLTPIVHHVPFVVEGALLFVLGFLILDRSAAHFDVSDGRTRRLILLSGVLFILLSAALPGRWGTATPLLVAGLFWIFAALHSPGARARIDKMAILAPSLVLGFALLMLMPLWDPLLAPTEIENLAYYLPYVLAITARTIAPAVAYMQEPGWYPALLLGGTPLMDGAFGFTSYLEMFLHRVLYSSPADVEAILYAAKVAILIVFVLGALGCYCLLRYGLRASLPASLGISLAFPTGYGLVWRHPEIHWATSIALLPLLAFVILVCLRRQSVLVLALGGAISGLLTHLTFRHPEDYLNSLYFAVAMFLVFGLAEHRPMIHRAGMWLIRSTVFGAASLLANYRFTGGLWDYFGAGNTIGTARYLTQYEGEGFTDGPFVVIKDVLAPLGLLGAGPWPPYGVGTPLYFGLPIAFLSLIGVFASVEGERRVLKHFALFALVLFPVLSMSHYLPSSFLYWLGIPGFPGHTGLRLSGMVLPSVVILAGLGTDLFLRMMANRAQVARVSRWFVGYVSFFLVVTAALGFMARLGARGKLPKHPFGAPLVEIDALLPNGAGALLQALMVGGLLVACWLTVGGHRIKAGVLAGVMVMGSLYSLPDSTMVFGPKYHRAVLAHLKEPQSAENNVRARLLRDDLFDHAHPGISLKTLLTGVLNDWSNPRTRYFAQESLLPAIAMAVRHTSDSKAQEEWRAIADDVSTRPLQRPDIERLARFAVVFDAHYVSEKKPNAFATINWLTEHTWPAGEPLRVAVSSAAKRVVGDSLHIWPFLETSHYLIMGVGNARWHQPLDYYSGEVERILEGKIYYDGNLLPLDVKLLKVLNFGFAIITANEAASKDWEAAKVLDEKDGLVLLQLPQPVPRAFFADPLAYEPSSSIALQPEKARIASAKHALTEVDLRTGAIVSDRRLAHLTRPRDGVIQPLAIKGNFAVFDVSTSGDAFMVYTDMYHPHWRAYVDGRPEEVVRTNLAFKGLEVPAGRHLVWFEFFSWHIYIAKMVALSTFVIILLLLSPVAARPRYDAATAAALG